ncbi:MAG: lysoplasmalogenase [Rhodanobacter sp.]
MNTPTPEERVEDRYDRGIPTTSAAMVAIRSSVVSAPRTRSLALVVSGIAAVAILGGALAGGEGGAPWQWLHWIAKPLATLLVLASAACAWSPVSRRYRNWIVAGMLFSLVGDICLMLPADLFVAGLLAFLCGHACFITAFLGDSRFAVRPWAWIICLLIGGANLALLWPSIPVALHLAVAVYGLVLSAMGAQALGRAWFHARHVLARPARRAAIGAGLFMLSDSLLAWNRFHGELPLATLWVLGSYYAALWFIARSVAQDAGAVESGPLQTGGKA